jgi:O-antigen/teichoic acid export membrane protein
VSERVVGRNFLTLGAGEIVARVLAFIGSAYLARALGAEMYGVVGFALAVLLYFSRLADGGLDLVGMREIARDRAEAARIVPAVLGFRIAASAALATLLAAGALAWLPRPDGPVLALFATTLVAVGAGTRWVHLGFERSGHPALARMVGEALALALVVALVRRPADVYRVPLAQLAGAVATAALLAWWVRARGVPLAVRWDWPTVRPLLARSARVVAAALLGLLAYNSDLIFLRFFRDAVTAGWYAAAYMPISLAINLGMAYRMSLLPTLARLGDERDGGAVAPGAPADRQRALYHTALAHLFAAVFPAALGGFLLAPQAIALIFGAEYAPAAPVLQILIWVIPIAQLREAPVAALVASAREDRLLRLNAVGTALNLGMNLILIPRYGMTGAAVTTVATESVRTGLAFAYARRAGFDPARLDRFWRATVAGLAMAALLVALRSWSAPWAFPLAVAAGSAAYLAALALLGGIRFRRGGLPALTV